MPPSSTSGSDRDEPDHIHIVVKNTISQDETERDDTLDHPKFVEVCDTISSVSDVSALSRVFRRQENRPLLLPTAEGNALIEEKKGERMSVTGIAARLQNSDNAKEGTAGPLTNIITNAINETDEYDIYGNKNISRTFDFLLRTISKLEAENIAIREELNQAEEAALKPKNDTVLPTAGSPAAPNLTPKAPGYEKFHMVRCTMSRERTFFRDVPRMFKDDSRYDHVHGRHEVVEMAQYLEENSETTFAVVAEYDCEDYKAKRATGAGFKGGRLVQDSVPAVTDATRIYLGPALFAAVKSVLQSFPDKFQGYDTERLRTWMPEPFALFYEHNLAIAELCSTCGLESRDVEGIRLLCNWFEENWRSDWDEANQLFSRGMVNFKHFRKLFRPNEILVRKLDDNFSCAKMLPYPWRTAEDTVATALEWVFNGSFYKKEVTVMLNPQLMNVDREGETKVTSLTIYPLRFADPELYDKMTARGEKFWKCRRKTLVCYRDGEDDSLSQGERRFMVDYNIYRRLHSGKDMFNTTVDDLGEEAMNSDVPPQGDFLALLPAQIHAYDLSMKAWQLIRVDRTTSATWNKSAFKRLVVPKDTKELIQAVVLGHIQKTSASLDIIAGKGNGILILLHGSPGTGKTLTAESIAEYNEMPLYRVTCGDVGMEPAEVEQYLTVVLEIGKAWGCVVLLDEADVFVEERALTDQKRNAIISGKFVVTSRGATANSTKVFLRVLEYYDGILILTTNRVGTFDDAFKSRIQLALWYPDLGEAERRQIWGNFFQMLRRTKERIDFEDLEMNVRKLSEVEINGRQIRNVITTARHLAVFRGERLVYKHFQDAISAVVKFNEYLTEVRGASDDVLAREERLR